MDQIVRQSLQEEPSLPEAGHDRLQVRHDCNWPPVYMGGRKKVGFRLDT